ncbi:MAG: hypothetical protein Satyrvirus24_11 [Satyrvirus sp.]|uniref:Uncharacterized protein n=1 Tax=Satyrvirus sp. TaxID=2487771 RepID=A0A3G5AEJ3_9VIRU|nr:MAG: hypothetical protein Satyrvirus24_11 [Satyrvirus sp.]
MNYAHTLKNIYHSLYPWQYVTVRINEDDCADFQLSTNWSFLYTFGLRFLFPITYFYISGPDNKIHDLMKELDAMGILCQRSPYCHLKIFLPVTDNKN